MFGPPAKVDNGDIARVLYHSSMSCHSRQDKRTSVNSLRKKERGRERGGMRKRERERKGDWSQISGSIWFDLRATVLPNQICISVHGLSLKVTPWALTTTMFPLILLAFDSFDCLRDWCTRHFACMTVKQ